MENYNKSLIIGLCLITGILNAQNFKYNTEQYGIKGSLLGGAIVAGTDDMSMTYYNPAAIYSITPGVDISIIQPRFNSFGFKQFWSAGEQSKINSTFELSPLQISFKMKLKNFDFAFIKINKSDSDDQFSAKQEFVNNNIQETRNFEYKYEGNNSWYGLGTSFKLRSKLYMGISQFVSVGKYSYRNEILTETIDANLAPNTRTNYFKSSTHTNYNNIGLITKIGLIYDTEKHDFGLTITTPTYLHFVKGGDFNNSRTIFNSEDTIIDGIIDLELSPKIKTPWEFNAGYSFVFNKSKLWLNASYHPKVADYQMAKIESISESKEWINGYKPIFNYGLGFSDQIGQKFELSGSIRMNNFAYENKVTTEDKVRNIILDGNTLHLSLGTKLNAKRHIILFGIDWGMLVDVPDKDKLSLLENIDQLETNTKDLTKTSVKILFTYGFVLDGFKK